MDYRLNASRIVKTPVPESAGFEGAIKPEI